MGAVSPSETSVNCYQTSGRHIQEHLWESWIENKVHLSDRPRTSYVAQGATGTNLEAAGASVSLCRLSTVTGAVTRGFSIPQIPGTASQTGLFWSWENAEDVDSHARRGPLLYKNAFLTNQDTLCGGMRHLASHWLLLLLTHSSLPVSKNVTTRSQAILLCPAMKVVEWSEVTIILSLHICTWFIRIKNNKLEHKLHMWRFLESTCN
jgi:hypothetical protein